MSLRQRLSRAPLLGLCTLAVLLLGVLGVFLTLAQADAQRQEQASRYGQALAERAASQAVEPALAQDMISLQVILQSLAKQPDVRGATIHDVENRLLVQSGSSELTPGHRALSFTAPITLDTHIAGHLTVTLSLAPVYQAYSTWLWLWTLAIVGCLALLWLAQHRLTEALAAPPPLTVPTKEEANAEPPALPDCTVIIELVFININELSQQLSRAGFEERLNRFDQHLRGILALYTGSKQHFSGDRLQLEVAGDSNENACFYGICISVLALGLCNTEDSPKLKLAANILAADTADDALTLSEAYHNPRPHAPTHQRSDVWIDPRLQSDALLHHIELGEAGLLRDIKPPYKALLERQQEQLQRLAHTLD
ncbi:hypothetical protein [Gilvimarinus algae]|uniref:Guanylate cyclase domain-containing protein n=1 Tax=Gilvimarinus algae TaxID=3058037 RepID=A0ABT8TLS9_9GAMM|nr:hypothetical protein [Gilvimarinus sp. SDUM040014]MDO3383322.1 hypothetical protein [Gilvimarinus sp. SDUM040014]